MPIPSYNRFMRGSGGIRHSIFGRCQSAPGRAEEPVKFANLKRAGDHVLLRPGSGQGALARILLHAPDQPSEAEGSTSKRMTTECELMLISVLTLLCLGFAWAVDDSVFA